MVLVLVNRDWVVVSCCLLFVWFRVVVNRCMVVFLIVMFFEVSRF